MGTLIIRIVEHLRMRAAGQRAAQPACGTSSSSRRRTGCCATAAQDGPARTPSSCSPGMLAEIRAYGEGIVVAEQIPTKLVPDVVKNTALKVVHRLPAEDDRQLVGAAMNLERGPVPRRSSRCSRASPRCSPTAWTARCASGCRSGEDRERADARPARRRSAGRSSAACGQRVPDRPGVHAGRAARGRPARRRARVGLAAHLVRHGRPGVRDATGRCPACRARWPTAWAELPARRRECLLATADRTVGAAAGPGRCAAGSTRPCSPRRPPRRPPGCWAAAGERRRARPAPSGSSRRCAGCTRSTGSSRTASRRPNLAQPGTRRWSTRCSATRPTAAGRTPALGAARPPRQGAAAPPAVDGGRPQPGAGLAGHPGRRRERGRPARHHARSRSASTRRSRLRHVAQTMGAGWLERRAVLATAVRPAVRPGRRPGALLRRAGLSFTKGSQSALRALEARRSSFGAGRALHGLADQALRADGASACSPGPPAPPMRGQALALPRSAMARPRGRRVFLSPTRRAYERVTEE